MKKRITKKGKERDIIHNSLKKRYFEIAAKENYPNTPDITSELDSIEKIIKGGQ
jgi:hypothetical protein